MSCIRHMIPAESSMARKWFGFRESGFRDFGLKCKRLRPILARVAWGGIMHLLDLYYALRGSSIPEPLFVAMASTGTLTWGLRVLDLGLPTLSSKNSVEFKVLGLAAWV